jgi:hypothetical protein
MFWDANAYCMQKALIRFRHQYALNSDAEAVLENLISWLGDQHRSRVKWSSDSLIRVLMGSDYFDKASVSDDILSGLQTLEKFSATLIDKLAALHATLTAQQRRQIADDFEKYEHVQKQWHGWSRGHRLRHREVA